MRSRFLVVVLAIVSVVPSYAQRAEDAVPTWLGWRVFHQRLVHLSQQPDGQQASQRFGAQFDLTAAQTASLLSAGQSFIGALQSIDDDAVAEAKRRFPDAFPSDNTHAPQIKTIPTGPRKTLRERAIENGLYAQVESKKQTLLNDHLQTLRRSLDPVTVNEIKKYVETYIVPRITFVTNPPTGRGNPGLPPGLNRDTPGGGR